MSSIYSPRRKCGVCANERMLHSNCKQCGNLCENCSGFHSKGNAFKNHNVVPSTSSDGMVTSSIEVEPSTQLDHLASTPTAKCTTTDDLLSTATNAPRPAYAPSTSSNAPTRDYASSTSTNAPTSHNVPPTSTNAPTSQNVPSTSSNAPSTSKKKGVKRKAASVLMKGMEKAACPKHKSNTVDLCCLVCDQAICSQCLTAAHTGRGHRIGDITDFFGKKRAMIERDLDLIQSHIQQREEAKKQLAEDLKEMEQASENVVKEVRDFADKVRSTILKKADDLKASTKEKKKDIVSRNGEFVKEIKKLETLRKKCQDDLDSKDLAVVLFRKETAFSLNTYENLPNSFKITPAAFRPAESDQDIMKSFGTIDSETIQEEPIAFRPPSTPIKMPGKKKKQTAQSSTPSPATSASAQDREILRDAVSKIGKEIGMNIVQ